MEISESCIMCDSTNFLIARNMVATRTCCDCLFSWEPSKKTESPQFSFKLVQFFSTIESILPKHKLAEMKRDASEKNKTIMELFKLGEIMGIKITVILEASP